MNEPTLDEAEKLLYELDSNRLYPELGPEALAEVLEVRIALEKEKIKQDAVILNGKENTENGCDTEEGKKAKTLMEQKLKSIGNGSAKRKTLTVGHTPKKERRPSSNSFRRKAGKGHDLINPDNSVFKKELREASQNRRLEAERIKKEGLEVKTENWAEELKKELEELIRELPKKRALKSTGQQNVSKAN